MSDKVAKAFEEFLRTRRDHRDGLTARQQLWTAFEAGAQFTLDEIRERTGLTEPTQETRALCPHGMPLDENVCGPCSEGRPNTVTRTVWTKNSESDPYCVHCGKTWDMHLCDGFSSCPTANR